MIVSSSWSQDVALKTSNKVYDKSSSSYDQSYTKFNHPPTTDVRFFQRPQKLLMVSLASVINCR